MRVEWGSLVSLDYEILLDSGEQVDSSRAHGPLRLRVGEWTALPGLGQKLVGLQAGDERLIRLAPREAFGDWDINAVLTMRESRLVEGGPLADGTTLKVETEHGASALCRAYRVSADRLALDFNHPLAGQALTLFVRITDVTLPA